MCGKTTCVLNLARTQKSKVGVCAWLSIICPDIFEFAIKNAKLDCIIFIMSCNILCFALLINYCEKVCVFGGGGGAAEAPPF